ncbi:nitrous oxide reductase accessory protein NosL [Rhodothermus profundi]|uniref:Copper chaperone NosL n=1 Tax=Rhodothermus profundi TaxID=633813 RepID=A0A1M6PR18_9BACT|nr:nitrous oxide reductase accessory protein NosL [Rhodothermus profundi]SHK10377.1 copper chaperone NosL [Rhodothermus profundi]
MPATLRRLGQLVGFSGLLLLSTCRPAPEPDWPPVIRFGYDACDYCRMLISEPRYAATLRTTDGQEYRFDDMGCLLHYLHEHPELTEARIWVHDYFEDRWLSADQAFFVRSNRLLTPMGYGIVALADTLAADSLAHALGGVLTRFASLREAPPPVPMQLP